MTAPILSQITRFEDSIALYVLFAGVGGMVLLALALARASLVHWLMGAALLFTALAPAVTEDNMAYLPTLLLPIAQRRAELHMTVGIALTLVVLLTGRVNLLVTPLQSWLIFAILVYEGLLQFVHETPEFGVYTILFGLATIPCMASASVVASGTYSGAVKTLRTIMWVSVAWTAGSAVQYVFNPQLLVTPYGRFFGLLANPQHAAVIVAPFSVIALWLLINDRGRWAKLLWTGLLAINLLFLGWTGSRTGFLQLVLGVTIVLYRRLGQAVLLLPLAAGMLWGLSYLAEVLEIERNIERLVSLDNTRSGLFESLAASINENPWIGIGWHDLGFSENSYLVGFAGFGILMFLLLLTLLFVSMWKCARYVVSRSRLPAKEQPIVDIFVAYNAMYFTGGFFEGYMLGRSSAPQVLFLIFAGIGVLIAESIKHPERYLAPEHAAEGHGAESEGDAADTEEPAGHYA